VAEGHFNEGIAAAGSFLDTSRYLAQKKRLKHAIFELQQAVESAYSCYLLTLTNYSPPSHNLKFLRGLPEDRDRRLADIWPRDHQRFTA
jgi:HEPN domain-containing protein